MNSTKQKLLDNLVIGIIIGVLSFYVIQYVLIHVFKIPVNDPNVRQPKIKVEYFLEVTEDSIYVESMSGKVYSGKYSDLDSLILVDNL
jgi:hypothetical protein